MTVIPAPADSSREVSGWSEASVKVRFISEARSLSAMVSVAGTTSSSGLAAAGRGAVE